MEVAVVGRKNEPPTTSFSQWMKYSTPHRVSTLRLSDSFGFGLGVLTAGNFRLRKRRFVDANYVSIKDVAAHCNTTKPPYGSRTNTSWV